MARSDRGDDPPRGYAIDAHLARRRFARMAAHEPDEDVLAREIERRMAERIALIRLEPARVLDAGAGLGASLPVLRERYPRASLVAVDSSFALVRRALDRAGAGGWRGRVARTFARMGAGPVPDARFICADLGTLPLARDSVGAIWSNLALNWARSLPDTFAEWHRVLEVGGMIVFSAFGPDTLRELRECGANVHRFVDMHDVGDMLIAAGFAEPVMDMERITLTYADVDALARDLRESGRSIALGDRPRGMTGRAKWAGIVRAYERFRRDGLIPVTVEVIYGHAWKPQPRQISDGRAIVRFERKRAQ